MNRKTFLKSAATLATLPALGVSSLAQAAKPGTKRGGGKILSAYYFRAHMYTMVPRHVRDDLQWMADHGTNAVCIALLEQDFFAARKNVDIIANEAARVGMQLFVVPSRWAGLIAGAPKVPSPFAVNHPRTWLIEPDGKTGAYCSVFYPEVAQFFKSQLDRVFSQWDARAIIWDEPKIYNTIDHSEAAIKKLGKDAPKEAYVQAFTDFWSDVNTHLKTTQPDVLTNLFLYANMDQAVIENAARIKNLDYFGCDGRPWKVESGGDNEGRDKVLLGNGERFLTLAKAQKKKTLWLVENHNMRDEDVALMDQNFPEILGKGVDHLLYYYYPRNLADPEHNMSVVGKHIANFT